MVSDDSEAEGSEGVEVAVEYRDIEGFPGYRVGSDGSVWSRRPKNGKGPFVKWRIKKPNIINKHGHRRVDLFRGKDERFLRYVHRLVLEAFVGPCPKGMECRHFPDRSPSNNSIENLSWSTHKENASDMGFHGTSLRGETNPNAKLNANTVRLIRKESDMGISQRSIALKHGICQAHVSDIVLRRKWAHV